MDDPNAKPSESTIDLVSGLISDARDLAVAHMDGLRLELKEEFEELKLSTKFAAIAIATFAVAGLLASFGLVQALWLYTSLPSWAAYLLTAAVFAAIGVAALVVRKRKVHDADLIPETQLRKLQQDAKWVAGRSRDVVA